MEERAASVAAVGSLARLTTALGSSVAAVLLLLPAAASEAGKPPCNIPSATGVRTIQLSDQGASRPFLLSVPDGYRRKKPVPLVINLHPSGSNGSAQLLVGDFAAVANRRRYAVAAPNGAVQKSETAFYWNVPGVPLVSGEAVPAGTPDDGQYLLRVIRAARRSLCIDPRRVYFTGYSGGARMASQMACDHPASMAAFAPVAGLRAGVPSETAEDTWEPDPATCKPRRPVSVLAFHGTADTTNPYLGNDDPRWGYGVEPALAAWAAKDRCRRSPETSPITTTVDLLSYDRCKKAAEVALYRSEGAGHTWPGDPATTPDSPIDATDLMLDFFADHRLPRKRSSFTGN
jgi:polyhydroxybutyrate depolymerase